MEKQQTIQYLTDLMATLQMAYYKKGMFTPPEDQSGFGRWGRLWVHETGDVGISIDLYDFFDDGLPECPNLSFDDQTRVAGMPARQRVCCISYNTDWEEHPLLLLCQDADVEGFEDGFDLEPEDVPVETLQSITEWIEGLLPPASGK